MKSKDIIRKIMNDSNISCSTLADRMNANYKTLYTILYTKVGTDLTTKSFTDILRALDYKVMVVPHSKRVNDDEYEVN